MSLHDFTCGCPDCDVRLLLEQAQEMRGFDDVEQNSPMPKTPAERQADFKQAMKEAGYVRLEAYVTKGQREKFRQIGGDEWLRKKIDAAKPKPADER